MARNTEKQQNHKKPPGARFSFAKAVRETRRFGDAGKRTVFVDASTPEAPVIVIPLDLGRKALFAARAAISEAKQENIHPPWSLWLEKERVGILHFSEIPKGRLPIADDDARRFFAFDHEYAHLALRGVERARSYIQEYGEAFGKRLLSLRSENGADVYAAARHLQRFPGAGVVEMQMTGFVRATLALLGDWQQDPLLDTGHFTSVALDKFCRLDPAAVRRLKPADTLGLAELFSAAYTPPHGSATRLCAAALQFTMDGKKEGMDREVRLARHARRLIMQDEGGLPFDRHLFYAGAKAFALHLAVGGDTLEGLFWDDIRGRVRNYESIIPDDPDIADFLESRAHRNGWRQKIWPSR